MQRPDVIAICEDVFEHFHSTVNAKSPHCELRSRSFVTADVTRHIAAVTQLAPVSAYDKRVLERRFDGLPDATTSL